LHGVESQTPGKPGLELRGAPKGIQLTQQLVNGFPTGEIWLTKTSISALSRRQVLEERHRAFDGRDGREGSEDAVIRGSAPREELVHRAQRGIRYSAITTWTASTACCHPSVTSSKMPLMKAFISSSGNSCSRAVRKITLATSSVANGNFASAVLSP